MKISITVDPKDRDEVGKYLKDTADKTGYVIGAYCKIWHEVTLDGFNFCLEPNVVMRTMIRVGGSSSETAVLGMGSKIVAKLNERIKEKEWKACVTGIQN